MSDPLHIELFELLKNNNYDLKVTKYTSPHRLISKQDLLMLISKYGVYDTMRYYIVIMGKLCLCPEYFSAFFFKAFLSELIINPTFEYSNKSNEKCMICFDIENTIQLECSHIFHLNCIKEWFVINIKTGSPTACPYCFRNINCLTMYEPAIITDEHIIPIRYYIEMLRMNILTHKDDDKDLWRKIKMFIKLCRKNKWPEYVIHLNLIIILDNYIDDHKNNIYAIYKHVHKNIKPKHLQILTKHVRPQNSFHISTNVVSITLKCYQHLENKHHIYQRFICILYLVVFKVYAILIYIFSNSL